MADYTKDSLQKKLEEEAPKIVKYLNGKKPTEAAIKGYYKAKGKRIGQNAVRQMMKHLS